ECPGPEPACVLPSYCHCALPLAVTPRVEVGAFYIQLLRLVLPQTELRSDPMFGNKQPDQPAAEVDAGIAVREVLMTRETNDREAPGQLLLRADSEYVMCDGAV